MIYKALFLNRNTRNSNLFSASNEKKKTFKRARDGAYCPIKAEIRTVDSQSDLRTLL